MFNMYIKTTLKNFLNENLEKTKYDYVRTPEFKAWFGDWENDPENSSKIVDSNGEPLLVYHGTPNNFDVFKKTDKIKSGIRDYGIYFTDSITTAKEYSNKPEENVEYLDWCEKLDDLKSKQDWDGWSKLYLYGKDIYKPNINTNNNGRIIKAFLNIRNPLIKDANNKHWFNAFKNVIDTSLNNDNDGVICLNVIEVFKDIQNTYIAFEPNQIRTIPFL